MPLLRYSLYSQNVNLYLAPTADARDTWLPLMRTAACEGRTFVLSANQCMRRKNLPPWITQTQAQLDASEGGSQQDPHLAGNGRSKGRRSSIITRTEDNHELVLPSPEKSRSEDQDTQTQEQPAALKQDSQTTGPRKPAGSRSSVFTKTENNHDLVLPTPGKTSRKNGTMTEGDGLGLVESSPSPSPPTTSLDADKEEDKDKLTETNRDKGADNDFLTPGGSCIIGPMGQVLAGPLWEVEDGGLLIQEVDFEDCERGRLDLDVAGSYSRNDAFKLEVAGLDLNPPP